MSLKHLSRRDFLRVSGMATAGVVLAACTPATVPGGDGGADGERRLVQHYAQGLTPRERLETDRWDPPQAMWDLEAQYEEAHPDVDIEFISDIPTGYDEWLVTQLSGGTAPEIVWYQRGWIARDYEKGWFNNLDPYLAQPNPYVEGSDTWKDTFQGPVIASGTAPDGHIYLITGDLVGTGFFYNKTVFEEVGVEVPETWDVYLEVQQALRDAGKIPFSVSYDLAGGVPLYGSWTTRVFQDVLYDHKMSEISGGAVVERTWKPGENLQPPAMVRAIRDGTYAATDPEWLEMLNLMKEWSVHYPEGFWALPSDDVFRLWSEGEAAVAWLGSWMNKPVRNDPLIDFEWGIFPKMPTVTEASSQFGGIGFPAMAGVGGVFQYITTTLAEERGVMEDTIDWMRFITAPTNLITALNDHGGFAPGVKDTAGADPSLAVYTDMLVDFGAERIEPFDSMLTREFVDTMWSQLQQFMASEITAEEMSTTIQGEMELASQQLLLEHPDWAEG
ncbi:MAG: ABC transporter substrate-binding protein [Chloroflexota bacterium]